MMSLEQACSEINSVDDALSAFCTLLKASTQSIEAMSMYVLLKPWQERLSKASCELNDLRWD